ncbi:hypothetical protein [Sodalis sp. (in: enterobacteria)]|uniref:hypothetical protein n=1 Tax=Sodalis sp. (in: enterobacteria) TaxID=1898979 RepID=UPI003F685A11
MSAEESDTLKSDVENLVRCAFHENTDYEVMKTWPYSRFPFSQLAKKIHQAFPATDSLTFSLDDITSALSILRLDSLAVNLKNG